MKSWKTSASGFIIGGIIILRSLASLIGTDVPMIDANGSVLIDSETGEIITIASEPFNVNTFLMGVGILGIGFLARDNDKSSEQVGVK